MEIVKFKDIKPAAYNPRRITETAFKELQGSLKTLGFILPIIVNKDNMTLLQVTNEQKQQQRLVSKKPLATMYPA